MKSKALWLSLIITTGFCMAASGATSKTFSENSESITVAAKKSIEARGIVTARDDSGSGFFFAVAKTWGHLSIGPEQDGRTTVVVTTGDGHGAKEEREIIEGITAVLSGKDIKPDQKSIEQAKKMEIKRSYYASLPSVQGPAAIIIHADPHSIKSALLAECISKGFILYAESDHQITLVKETAAPMNLIGALLVSPNAIYRKYRANVQFILLEEGNSIRIETAAEIIAIDGYGRATSQMVTSDPQVQVALQSILDKAKVRAELQSSKQ